MLKYSNVGNDNNNVNEHFKLITKEELLVILTDCEKDYLGLQGVYVDERIILQDKLQHHLGIKFPEEFFHKKNSEDRHKYKAHLAKFEGFISDASGNFKTKELRGQNFLTYDSSKIINLAKWHAENFLSLHFYFLVLIYLEIEKNKLDQDLPTDKEIFVKALVDEIWTTINAYLIRNAYKNILLKNEVDSSQLSFFAESFFNFLNMTVQLMQNGDEIRFPCGSKDHAIEYIVQAIAALGYADPKNVSAVLLELLSTIDDSRIQQKITAAIARMNATDLEIVVDSYKKIIPHVTNPVVRQFMANSIYKSTVPTVTDILVSLVENIGNMLIRVVYIIDNLMIPLHKYIIKMRFSLIKSLSEIERVDLETVVDELVNQLPDNNDKVIWQFLARTLNELSKNNPKNTIIIDEPLRGHRSIENKAIMLTFSETKQAELEFAKKVMQTNSKSAIDELISQYIRDPANLYIIVRALFKAGQADPQIAKIVISEIVQLLPYIQDHWMLSIATYDFDQMMQADPKNVINASMELLRNTENKTAQSWILSALRSVDYIGAKVDTKATRFELKNFWKSTSDKEIHASIIDVLLKIGLVDSEVISDLVELLESSEERESRYRIQGGLYELVSSYLDVNATVDIFFKMLEKDIDLSDSLKKYNLNTVLNPETAERLLLTGDHYLIVQVLSNTPISALLKNYQDNQRLVYLSLSMLKCLAENRVLTYTEDQLLFYDCNGKSSSYQINNTIFLEHLSEIKNLNAQFIDMNFHTVAREPFKLKEAVASPIEKIRTVDELSDESNKEKICADWAIIDSEYLNDISYCETADDLYPPPTEHLPLSRKLLSIDEFEIITSVANQQQIPWYSPGHLLYTMQVFFLHMKDTFEIPQADIPLPAATLMDQFYLTFYVTRQLQLSRYWAVFSEYFNKLKQHIPWHKPRSFSVQDLNLLQNSKQTIYTIIEKIEHYSMTRVGESKLFKEKLLPLLNKILSLEEFINSLLHQRKSSSSQITHVINTVKQLQEIFINLNLKQLARTLRYAEVKQARIEKRATRSGQQMEAHWLIEYRRQEKQKWLLRPLTAEEKWTADWYKIENGTNDQTSLRQRPCENRSIQAAIARSLQGLSTIQQVNSSKRGDNDHDYLASENKSNSRSHFKRSLIS